MSSENPYEPPKADSRPESRVAPRPERMPATVVVTMVLVTVIFLLLLASAFLGSSAGRDTASRPLLPFIITVVVVGGTVMRHPVAWHVSRGFSSLMILLFGVGLVLGAALSSDGLTLVMTLSLVGGLVANVSILWLMSTATARAWFGLGCPSCGDLHPFSVKFGHSLARCRECGTLWEPRTGMPKAG